MLIEAVGHHEVMFGYILIALIVIVGPLAYYAGRDSRIDESSRLRRYHG